jgi:hypothetical protein
MAHDERAGRVLIAFDRNSIGGFAETLPDDLSTYAVAGLCLHGGGTREEFERFVARCRESGTIPLGIADSYYYRGGQVVPEVDGLRRCFSDELPDILAEHFGRTSRP